MTVTQPSPVSSGPRETAVAGVAKPYPGPSAYALPGLMRKLWFDRLSLLADAADEFGDVVRFRMGPKTIYFFNHPDHAKHVLADNAGNYHKGMGLAEARRRLLGDGLLTSEGGLWRQQRRAIQPAFRRERIAGFAAVVTDEAQAMLARLDRQVDGAPVDLVAEMTRLTIAVLGRTLFDMDLSPLRFLGGAFEVAQDQAMFEMVTLGAVPLWLPLPRNRRFRAAKRQLEEAVHGLVAARERAGAQAGNDVISLLLGAYRDEPEMRLRRRMRDELVTIMLAGHETTASTLSWTWSLLARHPEAARAMAEEAAGVLGDRTPGYQDLARLRYTTMVIQEAMRLYPPVWGLPRKALAADVIGGYRVPAGADVMVCPYTLHRHPGFWPDPDRFWPERFEPAAAGPAHRYAYIPFGAGPRVCIGSHLGLLEATLVAAMVARRFRFELAGQADPEPEAMLSLRVRGGLPMRVRRA
jgi:enediyne biosynthesis protein E7